MTEIFMVAKNWYSLWQGFDYQSSYFFIISRELIYMFLLLLAFFLLVLSLTHC